MRFVLVPITTAALVGSVQAISVDAFEASPLNQLSYAMGDSTASAADPLNMAGYDAIIGRGLTEEGDDTMKNVLYYEDAENEDEKTRPMCTVGGTLNRPDFQGPSPDCCRVYESSDFMGLHYDFCIYDKDTYEKYW